MSEKFSVFAGSAGKTIRLITLTPERDQYEDKGREKTRNDQQVKKAMNAKH